MILIIDNYDSFVHNLARYVRELGFDTTVLRDDAITVKECLAMKPDGVIISPGPKRPTDTHLSLKLLEALNPETPLLGVCLGHQCLIEACGGDTLRSRYPLHGEASEIRHDGAGIFKGLPSPMLAGRYHSLIGVPHTQSPLVATASSSDGELMAVAHPERPWFGVQFHPESLLTPEGKALISNFLDFCKN
ncbi:aminodeoxychorismate/anthranilate synthase component II [Hyphococcus flavus]|uniref:Aminodeoxychorismate/anthranilate synthase component II n=1 Tax=Hyphococcus flavus TaxID=1866326 RepID=A0AAE9ZIA0_9PROT|nr:aminodeoxychorismate/anthranilate synthase component II [Hyphococcus flavus]WDI33187.1 aminodeoxychorismate/anthranilate synthase component II [Hyphococcus flavus]